LTAVPSPKIILHVNSFEIEAKAEEEVHKLERHGYNSFYQEKEVLRERRFLVYIGPFNGKQEPSKVGSN